MNERVGAQNAELEAFRIDTKAIFVFWLYISCDLSESYF